MPDYSDQAEPIHLEAEDGSRPVVVSEAQDRFLRTSQWAVEACKIGLGREVLVREWQKLVDHVRQWAERNASLIAECYAAPRDDQIAICVVPATNRFDFDLSDKLTELDYELAEKFQACPCDVIQVPRRSSETPQAMMPIYADQSRASSTMAHNRDFLATIDPKYSDWLVTVMFYTALHAVEVLFAHDGTRTMASHKARNHTLKTVNTYKSLWDNYRTLFDASRTTRYDCKGAAWVSVEDTKTKLAPKLYRLEQSILNMIGSAEKLPPIWPVVTR